MENGRGRSWTERASVAMVLAAGLALLSLIAIVGPFGTNDGPAHMGFSRLFVDGPAGPLQDSVYQVSHAVRPNMLIYILAGPGIGPLGPDMTERAVQLLLLLGLPLAGWFMASAFGRSGPLVALLLFTLAFNQMFFLGLYNFALSLVFCLLAFGCAVRADRQGGWWWAGFGAALLLALLAHAGGFIIALVLSAAWLVPAFVRDILSAPETLVRRWAPAVLAVVPTAVVLLIYMVDQPRYEVIMGPSAWRRFKAIIHFDLLRFNGDTGTWIGRGFKALAAGLLLWSAIARLVAWRNDPSSRFETVRLGLVVGAALVLALWFPDTAGGGWTHARRMYLGFYFALLILWAALPMRPVIRRPVELAALGLFALMLAGTWQRQREVRAITHEADALLAQVGAHCVVAPILPEQARAALPDALKFEPLFHVATRIEHHDDRVSLVNYLAPLVVYPVSYRPGKDPQETLYPFHGHLLRTGSLDIPAFEKASGLRVDYVFSLGPASKLRADLWPDAAAYRAVATSSGGRFVLYAPKGPIPAGVRSACRAVTTRPAT